MPSTGRGTMAATRCDGAEALLPVLRYGPAITTSTGPAAELRAGGGHDGPVGAVDGVPAVGGRPRAGDGEWGG